MAAAFRGQGKHGFAADILGGHSLLAARKVPVPWSRECKWETTGSTCFAAVAMLSFCRTLAASFGPLQQHRDAVCSWCLLGVDLQTERGSLSSWPHPNDWLSLITMPAGAFLSTLI
mmetsp:Transcript_11643/g.17361  ORF Transcript_11643/g.17361 Transcript_11643/m.17361 type:complete len:116 (+) Transcript_11643:133-480(+)